MGENWVNEDRRLFEELRGRLEEIVSLYGLVETEEALNVVVLGIRSRVYEKGFVVGIGESRDERF